MKTEEFYYDLPEELIAQKPCESRDHSRMMVVDRRRGSFECRHFYELPEFLEKDDLLVINNSRVIPAKLSGKKSTGATIEMLLLEKAGAPTIWETLLRPAKRVRVGTKISFDGRSWSEIMERISDKKWIVKFHPETGFDTFLEEFGSAPLPPYIKRKKGLIKNPQDLQRYQTVYAKNPGSVAAPTAGLHFSEKTLDTLRGRGTDIAQVTLHVGYGTFLPIESEFVTDHKMERETFEISEETAEKINRAKRVVAVGTTSIRTLESASNPEGKINPGKGSTNLFIYPGYRFKAVDRVLTNFHLPASSLFLLVCAFAGKDLMHRAYEKAIEEKFRFYSYGDCMLIL
ncbi:MAG: tRNA preQ1(34) S-adenosylmethionine ribosyltransferase-isomerase QueA [Thermodesulfobacteriota bacterium]|nr:tRNA preQ1(34) S-adenosylmethionine ribosyltransferase-isomerase QueA [Thermodesulfobacteriota bacterium]